MTSVPCKCPICEGTGNVSRGFYVDDPNRTKCRACTQGVVFAPSNEPVTVPVYPNPYPYPYQPVNPWPTYPWIVSPWATGPSITYTYTTTDKTNAGETMVLSSGLNAD